MTREWFDQKDLKRVRAFHRHTTIGLVFEGPWALFRLLGRAQIQTSSHAETFRHHLPD
jgi:type VI protein secretion system component VasK